MALKHPWTPATLGRLYRVVFDSRFSCVGTHKRGKASIRPFTPELSELLNYVCTVFCIVLPTTRAGSLPWLRFQFHRRGNPGRTRRCNEGRTEELTWIMPDQCCQPTKQVNQSPAVLAVRFVVTPYQSTPSIVLLIPSWTKPGAVLSVCCAWYTGHGTD